MSSVFDETEPVLTIPVKFTWIIDSTVFTGESTKLESPLFGANECFDSSTKFRLHINRNQSNQDKVFLELVSCDVEQIDLQAKIIYQGSTKTLNSYQKIALGKQVSVWYTGYKNSTVSSVHCQLSFMKPNGYKALLNNLSTDLGTLRKDSSFTDFVFRIGIERIKVHKSILSARSPVFKAMFRNKIYMENQIGFSEIKDTTAVVMEALLEFIYTGQVAKLDEIAPSLLSTAHKYQVELLVKACELSMTNTIAIDNAAVYLGNAERFNLNDLKAKSLQFINENPNSVMQTVGWKILIANNNALLQDLYKGMSAGKK